jgi:hypothetical protein
MPMLWSALVAEDISMHRPIMIALVGLSSALASVPASAQVPGSWHVTGDIDGKNFVLDCKFTPNGAQFGGICIGGEKGNAGAKPYKLTRGVISGRQIQWTYQTHVVFMSVDINFVGTVANDRITGTTSAAGRTGTFSAIKF